MRSIFALFMFIIAMLLEGCASSPVTYSTKEVNSSAMKNLMEKDGSLSGDFKNRYAKLAPDMTRAEAFKAMGFSARTAQVKLGTDDVRRLLYGDPKMATFEEAQKLRAEMATLCGVSISLESSKKSMYLTSPLFVGTELSGYRVVLDLIFKCKEDTLAFAQWRGNDRLEDSERSAIWTFIPGIGKLPNPASGAK